MAIIEKYSNSCQEQLYPLNQHLLDAKIYALYWLELHQQIRAISGDRSIPIIEKAETIKQIMETADQVEELALTDLSIKVD